MTIVAKTPLSFRLLPALGLCAAAMILAPAASAQQVQEQPTPGMLRTIAMLPVPLLKSHATVAGAYIRLGDLFDGSGAHADDVVANAPAPGGKQSYDANWLSATASEHGLNWQMPSTSTSIEVRRAAIVLSSDQIAQQLAEKIAGGRPDRKIRLDSMVKLYAPVDGSTDIAVDNLTVDQASGRFNADLRVPANDPTAPSVRVAGVVLVTMQVPVLNRPLQYGEVIGPDDITWTSMPASQVTPGSVMDPAALIGYAARRALRPDTSLRPVDVQQPVVVHRNDLVTIVLEQPGLYITVEGKAMDDGGRGQVIQVTNLQSKRILQAVVQAGGQVSIPMPGVATTVASE